ncbi:hypothetical protein [Peribacillus butanolivorans]|uniref:hypothetical protein n=1 Tax=Peribacillus butanolivorans TaxID=421767 RepID=UPI0036DDC57B
MPINHQWEMDESVKKAFFSYILLALLVGEFTFSSINISYAEETDWDRAEFERLKLLDTIEFYGLDILQEEAAVQQVRLYIIPCMKIEQLWM